jgi:hypothetical protein
MAAAARAIVTVAMRDADKALINNGELTLRQVAALDACGKDAT